MDINALSLNNRDIEAEIMTVRRTMSLPRVVERLIDAWYLIERTWERGSYRMCPWWIWREDDEGVLQFNLLGLACFAFGWTDHLPNGSLYVEVGHSSQHIRRLQDKRYLGLDLTRHISEALHIYPECEVHKFFGAINAVRRGAYETAASLYYHGGRAFAYVGPTSGPKVYILGDESSRDPQILMVRLRRDIECLGPVDIHDAYRV